MCKSFLFAFFAFVLTVLVSPETLADEPHEVWLKALVGTWTWEDEERGKVTVTFTPQAEGKCVLGMGKDGRGSFVAIIGWAAESNSLTDTGFHSNGGNGRIVYDKVTPTTLQGIRTGAGPGGEPLPEAKFHVVRDGSTLTVNATDASGETTTVTTKAANE